MVRRALRRAYEADERRAGLTGPQTLAMTVLAKALHSGQDGLTIREMGEQMGLAQSTVSSLVDRLERKELILRESDPLDRRCTRVALAAPVKQYLHLQERHGPLVAVMQRATADERQTVLTGLSTLLRLLDDARLQPDAAQELGVERDDDSADRHEQRADGR
jgi:DNA-binding MarR family transcriptional regulator